MATFKKYLSTKVDQNGRSQICLFVFITKENRFRVKTPFFVSPEFFNSTTGEIMSTNSKKKEATEAIQTKVELGLFISQLASKIMEQDDKDDICKEWVEDVMDMSSTPKRKKKPVFQPKDSNSQEGADQARTISALMNKDALSVNEAIDLYIGTRTLSQSRVKHYNVMKRLNERFTMFKRETSQKKFVLQVNTLDPGTVLELRDYILNEATLKEEHPRVFDRIEKKLPLYSNPKKPRAVHDRGNNYVYDMMKRYKAVFNWLYQTDQTKNQPFKNIQFGQEVYGKPIYITREERDKIADFDLSGAPMGIQIQRDIFVFQCFVGCRVSDLMTLKETNIIDGVLEYVPKKTKDNAEQTKPLVPLTARAIELVRKYRGMDNKGRLFPFISQQHYNDAIREVFRLCGIDRSVIVRNPTTGNSETKPIYEVASSHMARRTFIGLCYKKVKDPNLIGSMSGHVAGSKAFNRYRAIDVDDLKEVISAIS